MGRGRLRGEREGEGGEGKRDGERESKRERGGRWRGGEGGSLSVRWFYPLTLCVCIGMEVSYKQS